MNAGQNGTGTGIPEAQGFVIAEPASLAADYTIEGDFWQPTGQDPQIIFEDCGGWDAVRVNFAEPIVNDSILTLYYSDGAFDRFHRAEEYLMGSYILTHSVQHMLEEGLDASDILLPMLFVETAAGDGTLQSRVYGTEGTFVPHDEKAKQIILSDFLSKDRTWEDLPDEDLSRILAYINAKIQSDNLEERTLKTMLDLMNGPAIRIIKA